MAVSGTFKYSAVIPEDFPAPSVLEMSLDEPIERSTVVYDSSFPDFKVILSGDPFADIRLVGFSPKLQIIDAGMTIDVLPREKLLPNVELSRLQLTASRKANASVSAASFYVDKRIVSKLLPGDVLHMTRTRCAGLGISIFRDQQLVLAAGAVRSVPLGPHIKVEPPWDLIKAAEAIFQKRYPTFRYSNYPLEISIDDHRHLDGYMSDDYQVFKIHGFLYGLPGQDECLTIRKPGLFSHPAVQVTAALLDSRQIELVEW